VECAKSFVRASGATAARHQNSGLYKVYSPVNVKVADITNDLTTLQADIRYIELVERPSDTLKISIFFRCDGVACRHVIWMPWRPQAAKAPFYSSVDSFLPSLS
jgi:hypothetical protein